MSVYASGPAQAASAITPSNVTVFDNPTRAVYVGGAGDVVARMAAGQNDVTFSAVPAGTILPIAVDMVKTSSTATLMVALS